MEVLFLVVDLALEFLHSMLLIFLLLVNAFLHGFFQRFHDHVARNVSFLSLFCEVIVMVFKLLCFVLLIFDFLFLEFQLEFQGLKLCIILLFLVFKMLRLHIDCEGSIFWLSFEFLLKCGVVLFKLLHLVLVIFLLLLNALVCLDFQRVQ